MATILIHGLLVRMFLQIGMAAPGSSRGTITQSGLVRSVVETIASLQLHHRRLRCRAPPELRRRACRARFWSSSQSKRESFLVPMQHAQDWHPCESQGAYARSIRVQIWSVTSLLYRCVKSNASTHAPYCA